MSRSEVLLDMEDILKDVYQRVFASDIADRLETHLSRLMRYLRQHPDQKEELTDLKERLKDLIQHYRQAALEEYKQQGPQTTMMRRGRPMKEVIDFLPSADTVVRRRGRTGHQVASTESMNQEALPQPGRIRKGDPIDPDRRYSIDDAAALLGKKRNTLYDYNSRKDADGNRRPLIPYGTDQQKGVWYLGQDLIRFLNGGPKTESVEDPLERQGRRKHEGKGKREFNSERPLEKARLSELKKMKEGSVPRRSRR